MLGQFNLARGDSLRQLHLEDLRANYSFGPDSECIASAIPTNEEHEKNRPCLSAILQKRSTKYKNEAKQEVGAYCHKYVLACPVGNTL